MASIIMNSGSFLELIEKVSPALPSKAVLPILLHIQLVVRNGLMTLKATDLKIQISTSAKVDIDNDCEVCFDPKEIVKILSTLSGSNVTFEINETNGIKLTSEFGKYEFVGLPAKDFPQNKDVADPACFDMDSQSLIQAIEKTAFCMSRDELKPNLHGVFLGIEKGSTVFCSSNMHVMSRHIIDHENDNTALALIPRHAVSAFKACLPEYGAIHLEVGLKNIRFKTDSLEYVAQLSEHTFPPSYETVIPKKSENVVVVDKSKLIGAVKRVSTCADIIKKYLKVTFNGAIQIEAEDKFNDSSASESIECIHQGEQVTLGLNHAYLLQVLNHIEGDTATIYLIAHNKPVIFTGDEIEGEDSLMLIMPTSV